jgi:hypothetical protein
LLTRLAQAIARRRAYGAQHPMVAESERALAELLGQQVHGTGPLTLAVAHRELLVNGHPSPIGGPAQEIATRLHLMNVGAARFQPGLTPESVEGFVALLARRPAEVAPDAPLPELPGILLARIDYEQLGLADEAAIEAETSQLWQALAERVLAAVEADGVSATEAGASPTTLGAALSQAGGDDQSARQAFEALTGVTDQVSMAPRRVRELIGERLQALLSATDQGAIIAAIRSASPGPRARLVTNVVDVLPAAAVVRWLNSAALASGRDLSPHLLRLLAKLSVHYRGRRPEVAAEALREAAHELVQGWELGEPNPEEHATLLDTLAAWSSRSEAAAVPAGAPAFDGPTQEAARLVQMAIELDTVSEDAANAVRRLADQGHAATVLAWLDRAGSDATRERIRELTLTPVALMQVLVADSFDATHAKQLLDVTPPEAARVLIDALEQCESRTGRRLIFDRLRTMPAHIAGPVCERLAQPMPWFLARNLLALLRELTAADEALAATLAPGSLLLFQKHAHPAVRREAVRLLVQLPALRGAVLKRALADDSADVRHTAIDAAYALRTQSWPGDLAQRLCTVADDATVDDAYREKAVRALTGTTSAEVCNWLVAHVSRRSALRGALKLATPTPTVRAALQLLSTRFAAAPEAEAVLALARKSALVGARA